MEEKKQNEELQSRREFFKESSKKVLPILAIAAFGSSLLTACEKEPYSSGNNNSGNNSGGCKGCSGSCSGSCSGGCDGGCSGGCDDNCTHACFNSCDHYLE